MGEPTVKGNPIDKFAKGSLLAALALALTGMVLRQPHLSPFWGGLLMAFGEAALVGGLADWFAVRALFTHPFGIPFPHSALIPRNRPKIVKEIRALVQNEWLPKELLVARVQAFNFVGDGLLSLAAAFKPKLQDVLRTVAREVLGEVEPQSVAVFLAQAANRTLEAGQVTPFLAGLTRRAREEHWLEPLLRAWMEKLNRWAGADESRALIRKHLHQAANKYQDQGWFKRVTFRTAEALGGINLDDTAGVLQSEIQRFTQEQLADESQLRQIVEDGLTDVERRLREDPEFMTQVRKFILEAAESGTLAQLLDPAVAALRDEGLRQVETEGSPVLAWIQARMEVWLERLAADPEETERVNAWCRRMAVTLIDKHHPLIGSLVEEQLNRLSDENLVTMIENKVGEDLNWIRINGTFVGGLVGVIIYLAVGLFETVALR